MSELNLDRLEKNKEAILKAEIVSMLTLWEKISPNGDINKAHITLSDINWENELNNREITFRRENNGELKKYKLWDNFLNNWRNWRKQHSPDYLLQILYGISESLNSGVDKGSPKKEIKVEPKDERWLSNAFGSFKRKIIYLEKNEDEINNIIDEIKDKILCSLNKTTISLEDLEEIRNKLKKLLSGLLSDDRFPINDVSLWEQTYMPTSMFKALLSNYILINSDFDSIPDRQQVKWRILGIQYDKIGIAEKSLKLALIFWYRNIAKEIDEEIKKLLEVEYPIGNEIYRDETGIYFIVGEDLGEDLDDGSNLAEFKLKELEDKILEIFKEKTEDEFYPAIFLTKASRGLMNLSYLLEKAKENFLKIKWRKKDLNLWLIGTVKGKAIGICPICQTRLIYEKDKEKRNQPTICETCDSRIHHKQVEKWIDNLTDNLTGETIWIEEIKDKNNRVAYVSLKFELKDWLNGNLVNSLLGRKEDFEEYFQIIKKILDKLKKYFINFKDAQNKSLEKFRDFREIAEIENFLNLFDKKGVKNPYNNVIKKIINLLNTENIENYDEDEKDLVDLFEKIFFGFLDEYWDNVKEKENNSNSIKNRKGELILSTDKKILNINKFKDYYQNGKVNLLLDIFSYAYIYIQIRNILLERSIGHKWEEFIYKQLDDWDIQNNKPKKEKIDFDNRKIYWDKLTNKDIEFLATLLLQFLLRKNPSPARLRRIWETTQEFFEDIHNNLEDILKIPEWRRKRLVWEIKDDSLREKKPMELEADGILFWMEKEGKTWTEKINSDKAEIYLISSISDFIDVFGNEQLKELKNKALKNDEKAIEELNNIFSSKESLKNYLQEREINLKEYKTDKQLIKINIKSNLKEIHIYKPFTSIIDPSPINYQIVIPAEYLPNLIDEVIARYNKEFKYVYGKLPIHIGIVISDYKKPVYINLKALRKIRRDVEDIDNLFINKNQIDFRKYFRHKTIYYGKKEAKENERKNKTKEFYSLYWDKLKIGDYNFYLKPSLRLNKDCSPKWKKWLISVDKLKSKFKTIQIIPNTFDFEYLDHNIRRNEIFYNHRGKREISTKQNRPYELEIYWKKFKKFKELFTETNLNPTRMHKLVELLYSKLQREKDYNPDYSYLLTSSFIELLELNKKGAEYSKRRKIINDIFDLEINSFEELSKDFRENLKEKLTKKENIYLFLDMFEFWHTAMKEV